PACAQLFHVGDDEERTDQTDESDPHAEHTRQLELPVVTSSPQSSLPRVHDCSDCFRASAAFARAAGCPRRKTHSQAPWYIERLAFIEHDDAARSDVEQASVVRSKQYGHSRVVDILEQFQNIDRELRIEISGRLI